MHQMTSRSQFTGRQGALAGKQNFRLLVALFLLLVALGVVLVKDRDFWFGSEQAAVVTETPAAESTAKSTPPAAAVQPPAIQPTAKAHVAAKPASHSVAAASSAAPVAAAPAAVAKQSPSNNAADSTAPVVTGKRVVLPPLDVEVVAGDKHSTVHPGSTAAKVEILRDSNRTAIAANLAANLPTNASERERLTPVSAPEIRQNIDAAYPLLGQHMKVQGSVILQAVIGADGSIENLQVVSGPAILATAAQQAVREWHFKPYLQNGQPVETKTRITVNFSIRVADNPASSS